MEKLIAGILLALLALILLFVIGIVTAIPVYFLWNWLVPIVFVGAFVTPHITLFQAWGIAVLCGILFKGSSTTTSKD